MLLNWCVTPQLQAKKTTIVVNTLSGRSILRCIFSEHDIYISTLLNIITKKLNCDVGDLGVTFKFVLGNQVLTRAHAHMTLQQLVGSNASMSPLTPMKSRAAPAKLKIVGKQKVLRTRVKMRGKQPKRILTHSFKFKSFAP